MTYAPTVAYLKAQALAAGAGSFWHGKQQTQSVNYNAPFPQVHLFLMPAPLVGINVQYRPVLCFYGADTYESPADLSDTSAADNSLTIQDAMDLLSQQFIALLRDDEDALFDLSDQVDRAPVLREGSQIGTGFVVNFTLTARAAVC